MEPQFKITPIFPSEEAELRYLGDLKTFAGLSQTIDELVAASRKIVFAGIKLPFGLDDLQALAKLLTNSRVAGSEYFNRMTYEDIIDGFKLIETDPSVPQASLAPEVNTFDKAVYTAIINLCSSDMCPRGASNIDPAIILGSVMGLVMEQNLTARAAVTSSLTGATKAKLLLAPVEEEAEEEAGTEGEEAEGAESGEEEAPPSEGEEEADADEEAEEEADEEAPPSEEGEEEESGEGLSLDDIQKWLIATFGPSPQVRKKLPQLIETTFGIESLSLQQKLEKLSLVLLKSKGKQASKFDYRAAVKTFLGL